MAGKVAPSGSLDEAAPREVRERLNHVMAGFDKEQRDVKTGLRILASLGLIWDRCGTVQHRRQFAKLLFSRVTVDGKLSAARMGSE